MRDALYVAKICSYAQGMALLRAASHEYDYNCSMARSRASGAAAASSARSSSIASVRPIGAPPICPTCCSTKAFAQTPPTATARCAKWWPWQRQNGIPVLAFSSALAYYDAYRSARLPANLTQAQRDYFGAHTYQRVDQARGKYFHTNWTGQGGKVTATVY